VISFQCLPILCRESGLKALDDVVIYVLFAEMPEGLDHQSRSSPCGSHVTRRGSLKLDFLIADVDRSRGAFCQEDNLRRDL